MSVTQPEDILAIVETDLTDEAIQMVIDQEEAWLATQVGDLASFTSSDLVKGSVTELVWIRVTAQGVVTSQRQGSSSTQGFQQPDAAAQLRKDIVRRLRPLVPTTVTLKSSTWTEEDEE